MVIFLAKHNRNYYTILLK